MTTYIMIIITIAEELGEKELAEWQKSMDRVPRALRIGLSFLLLEGFG